MIDMMKLVFWQNVISPHQSYVIRNLSYYYEVVLIFELEMYPDRIRQGWEIPSLGNVELVNINNKLRVDDLVDNSSNCHHIFNGILSYSSFRHYFKKIVKWQKVSIISESPIQLGIKKNLRFLKYKYLAFRYDDKIANIFAMGDLGVRWFMKTGFSSEKIHKFGYTIEVASLNTSTHLSNPRRHDNICNLVFVGQLIERKGIDNLINTLCMVGRKNWVLNIFGDGPQKKKLINKIRSQNLESNFVFHGSQSNSTILQYLFNCADYLVLPSRFDGWGAVVNEALSCGVKVITNHECGASCLIIDDLWGHIYNQSDRVSLYNTLNHILNSFNNSSLKSKQMLSEMYVSKCQNAMVELFRDKLKTV